MFFAALKRTVLSKLEMYLREVPLSIDYIEFYLSDAQLTSYFYRTAFGLEPLLYTGPELGVRDRFSLVVGRADVRLILTSGLDPESAINRHVAVHGDGIHDIAFRVPDAARAFEDAVARGAKPVREPAAVVLGKHRMVRASIKAFGGVIHSFVERKEGEPLIIEDARFLSTHAPPDPSPILGIDHMAIALNDGTLEETTALYEKLFGMIQIHREDVRTEYTAMNSKVIASRDRKIKLAMMETAPGKRASQVDDFLYFNRGPGVQHLAFLTADIIESAQRLRRQGISFLYAPPEYYAELEARVGKLDLDLALLEDLRILVARDEGGLLLQAFTKPIHSRPTFFTEVIQRDGARGFGSDNVKALFRAIEREQLRRADGGRDEPA